MEFYKATNSSTNKEAYILVPDKYNFLKDAYSRTGLIFKNSKLRIRYHSNDFYNNYEKITKENISKHIRKLKSILKIFKQYQNDERCDYTDNQLPSVSIKLFYNEFIEFYNEMTDSKEEFVEEPELKISTINNSYAFEMINNLSSYPGNKKYSNGLFYDADYKNFTLMNLINITGEFHKYKPIALYELVFNNKGLLEEVKSKIERRKRWLTKHYLDPLPQSVFLLIDLYDKIIKLEEKYKIFN